jgi:hypothetical protein
LQGSPRLESEILAKERENEMNTRWILRAVAIVSLAFAAAASLPAQSDMRGHWSGAVETPAGPLNMEVDLDQTSSGWIGSISIPAQGASGIPLEGITFSEGKAVFLLKAGAGAPGFSGTLSADGKSLTGEFSQGTVKLPMKLSRTGDAKVEVPKTSPQVAAEFVGTWQGVIEGPGLHVTLAMANTAAGAEALLVSVDQGGARIPVTGVIQQGKKLSLTVSAVGGGYDGEMSADGSTLTGNWTQLGNSVPLTFRKAAQ